MLRHSLLSASCRLVILSLGLVLTLAQFEGTGRAQAPVSTWSNPIDLAASVASRASWDPKIVTDLAGNIHVVWRGWAGEGYTRPEAWNAIFYTWWDGEKWSEPVDVYLPSSPSASLNTGIATTATGKVVIATASPVAVSVAPIGQATDARNWQTTTIASGKDPALAIDQQRGHWYVSYTSDDGSIMVVYSEDEGETWSDPRIVATATDPRSYLQSWSIAGLEDGSVHLVWSEHREQRNWGGEAIWHARLPTVSADSIEVREVARNAETTLDAPILAAGNDGFLHLFWNNGVASTIGRSHQWSEDYGKTWSIVEPVFPGLSGQTEQAGLAVDSEGRLHVVTAADGFGYSFGVMRYATWENGSWSNFLDLFPDQIGRGERPALAITGGNQLHLVWLHPVGHASGQWNEYDGFIAYTLYRTESLSVPEAGITNAVSQPVVAPTMAATPPSQLATTVALNTTGSIVDYRETHVRPNEQTVWLLFAVLVTTVFVAAVVVMQLTKMRGKN